MVNYEKQVGKEAAPLHTPSLYLTTDLINRRAPKSYRSARASIFSACACHTARSSTCALRCYTDISIRFTLCNKETKERVYKIGKGTARGVYNQSLDG